MKITKTVSIILAFMAVFAMTSSSETQVYQLSTPISGSMTMSARDLNGPTGSSAGFSLNFTNLAETIYLDSVALTVRQIGTISYFPSATNFQFVETQSIPGQFPNPPTEVSGNITVALSVGSNGISFDTGPQAVTWHSDISGYTVADNGYVFVNGVPMNGSYTLVTGSQTFSGSFSYTLFPLFNTEGIPSTFNNLYLDNAPYSIQLSGLGTVCISGLMTSSGTVADVVATNGFEMQLSPGAEPWACNYGYIGEVFHWSSGGAVTATNVPSGSPSISDQPLSTVTNALSTAMFTVSASGTPPLSYQWSLNGTNIAGATGSTLTIANVTQTNLGTYTVVVTNEFGLATSSNATLSMPPFIAVPFTGAVTYFGQSIIFGLQAWGTGPLNYQWFKDGVVIRNATNPILPLANIQFTNAGLYSVVITSLLGSVTNPPAQVLVEPAGIAFGLYPGITITGVVGQVYLIQSTANLSVSNSWLPLTNITLTQPVQIWVDTSTDASLPANPHKFYQVLLGQ
jgi:hypothetical protein